MSRGDYSESKKYGVTRFEAGQKTIAVTTVVVTQGAARLVRLLICDHVSGDKLTVLGGPGSLQHFLHGLHGALAELDALHETTPAPPAPPAPAPPPAPTQRNVGGRRAKDDGMRRPGQPRGRTTP